MKRVIKATLIIVVILIVGGCAEGDYTNHEEIVKGVEYDGKGDYSRIIVETDKGAFKQRLKTSITIFYTKESDNIEFIRGKDKESKVEYKKTKRGDIKDIKFYLGEEDIGEYSKGYIKVTGINMKIKDE